MRSWWVNQNQTYRHELAGGYLWPPKRKSNGGINPFYERQHDAFVFFDRALASIIWIRHNYAGIGYLEIFHGWP
jgi:hypothetical protein